MQFVGVALLVGIALIGTFAAERIREHRFVPWLIPIGFLLLFCAGGIYFGSYALGFANKALSVALYIMAFIGWLAGGMGMLCFKANLRAKVSKRTENEDR